MYAQHVCVCMYVCMYVQYGKVRIYSTLTTISIIPYMFVTRTVDYHRKGIQVPVCTKNSKYIVQ